MFDRDRLDANVNPPRCPLDDVHCAPLPSQIHGFCMEIPNRASKTFQITPLKDGSTRNELINGLTIDTVIRINRAKA